MTLADSTCRLLACDFDGGTWRLDAAAYAEAAAWAGVPAAVDVALTVAAITSGAKTWSKPELEAALAYEQANASRKGALAALEGALNGA